MGKSLGFPKTDFGGIWHLEFCISYGANLGQKTEMGETALAVATKAGNIEICQRLLLAGASIKERDANGQNCLILALQKNMRYWNFSKIQLTKKPRLLLLNSSWMRITVVGPGYILVLCSAQQTIDLSLSSRDGWMP